MKTYIVNFASDAEFASHAFDAETPEQALKKARRFADDPLDLTFQLYDGGMPVNEIAICDREEAELAVWRDADLRLRLAAQEFQDPSVSTLRLSAATLARPRCRSRPKR